MNDDERVKINSNNPKKLIMVINDASEEVIKIKLEEINNTSPPKTVNP